jgi:hypothetical protein
MDRFNLKKLNDVEVEEQYHVKISNRFTVLGNLYEDVVDITKSCESVIV